MRRIAARAILERNVRLGDRRPDRHRQRSSAAIPQDLKYSGEETWVEIGDGTVIREYTTINRGTAAIGRTTVGSGCFMMTYVHLAHDCHIGDGVVIANRPSSPGT